MPLRLLAYMAEIYTRHHKSHGLPLPPVLPFVLHQGPETWNVSTDFADLFQLPPQLAEPLSPYLPKFHHALLDLTSFDPSANENDTSLRVVLQLMKLSRRKELLRFFQWLAKFPARELPESFLGLLLLYALHSDSDLDAEQIYHTLSTNPELEKSAMSVAEKLKAQGPSQGLSQGLSEGRAIGLWIGKIQAYEEFLGKNPSPRETLDHLSIPQLEALHHNLREEYESRFKRPE